MWADLRGGTLAPRMKKIAIYTSMAAIAVAATIMLASAGGPTPPPPGLRAISHGPTLTGSGSSGDPMNVPLQPDGGLQLVVDGGIRISNVTHGNTLSGNGAETPLDLVLQPDGGLELVPDGGIRLKDEVDILGLRLNGTYVMSSDTTNSNVQLLSGTSVITAGWYGDGSDGTCNYDGSTTVLGVAPSGSVYNLNRTTFCNTETVSTGITVNVTGYPIYVRGTLTVNGSGHFANNGNDGTTPSGACSAPAGGAQLANGIFTSSPGTAGGNGGTTGGVHGGDTTFTCRGLGAAGAGGNGASGTGGAGGTKIDMAATAGDCHDWHHLHDTGRSFSGVTTFWVGIGGGGGGGTNVANGCGGGGGSGAGGLVVYAHRIAGTGTLMFTATGGNGGNGNNNVGCTGAGNGCGGGGGGTGGLMYVITGAFFGSGCTLVSGSPGTSTCISVAGGNGGTKTGTTGNTNGTGGGSGVAIIEVGG